MKTRLDAENIVSEPVERLAGYLHQIFGKQWRRYRKAFKRCKKDFSENSVHELRVEIRRMLALVTLFHALWWDARLAEIESRLKRLFKRFSELRDTHVQLMFVQEAQERFPELARFHKRLSKREVGLTRSLSKSVGRFRLKRLGKLVDGVQQTCRHRDKASLGHRSDWPQLLGHVEKAFTRATELRSRIDPRDAGTIHRVRIALKKFRYLVEPLRPLIPGVSARQIEAMHEYQSMMGEIQDIETLQSALDDFISRKKGRLGKHLHFRDYLCKRRSALVRRYLRHASRLDSFWPPRPNAATAHRASFRNANGMGG